jgi:hypothetical protein
VLDQDTPPPCVIGTIGLHGSASTWVFNVVRELMIAAAGEAQVVALYTEELDELPGDARSGKWCELPVSLQVALTRRFGAFLDRFGYSR